MLRSLSVAEAAAGQDNNDNVTECCDVCLLQRLQQCKTRTTALNTVLSLFEEQLALLAAESSASLMRPASRPRNPDNER